MTAPPTLALTLVVEKLERLRDVIRDAAMGTQSATYHAWANELYEIGVNLSAALSPPDAIRAAENENPVAWRTRDVWGWAFTDSCDVASSWRADHRKTEPLFTAPPSGAALRGEVVAHRWHWAGTHGEWQDGPGDPRVIAEIGAREGYRLEKAYAAPSPAQGWRPIELDSPEDCDVVMLWWPGQSIRDYPFVGTTDDAETMRSAKPTHWMPLPAPPPPAGESQ